MCKDELATNNQLYNLLFRTSFLMSRSIRLAHFYLAIVLDFALNALFFNLYPAQASALQNIFDNFWASIYSALFALFPLFIIGAIFTIPAKYIRKLKLAHSTRTIRRAYSGMKKWIRCRTAFGFLFFALLSNFLLLYLICFAHVANTEMSGSWIKSSSLTVLLDLIVFELVPAFMFALLCVLRGFCVDCKGVLLFVDLIELFRLYRNLTEG